jgi:hypothetical protein
MVMTMMARKAWLVMTMILTVVSVAGGTLGASGDPGKRSSTTSTTTKTATKRKTRLVGSWLRREDAPTAEGMDKLPTLQDLQDQLQRGHQERSAAGAHGPQGRRKLIYNGRPTGGSKYPSLVSMWLGTSNDVRIK